MEVDSRTKETVFHPCELPGNVQKFCGTRDSVLDDLIHCRKPWVVGPIPLQSSCHPKTAPRVSKMSPLRGTELGAGRFRTIFGLCG